MPAPKDPIKCLEWKRKISERLVKVRINDKYKDDLAVKQGYKLFRVWEDELYKLENFLFEKI